MSNTRNRSKEASNWITELMGYLNENIEISDCYLLQRDYLLFK